MASLGQVNHVLTNAGTTYGNHPTSTTLTYTCESVDANGNSIYRETGGSSTSDISYHPVNGWSDVGSNNPYYFGNEVPITAMITPAYDATTLIMSNANVQLVAELNTGYSSTTTGGSGSGTGTEGVPSYDMNKNRLLITGLTAATYNLSAQFGNGDVWTFTVPATQSYNLLSDGSEASPGNLDSADEFAPGTYELTPSPGTGVVLETFVISSTTKKVHCNFW